MTTKRLFTTICTLALTLSMAWAQGPNGSNTYYQAANGKKGAALKTALCGIIYNRTSERSYKQLWEDFKETDKRSDGKVWDMYSGISNFTFGTDQAGSYNSEGDVYNREHSFPKSWFGDNTPMYTDLFHLYPTDGWVNNKRSNHPFGEVDISKITSEDMSAEGFSKWGPCSYPGYTGTVFEPNDLYKGDFARTYFYMVTCYEEKIVDWYSSYSSSIAGVKATLDGKKYPGLSSWQLNMLLKWTKNDQVSAKERARNIAVAGIQGNRNPFIDYPGLEEYIWGEWKDVEFSYDNYVSPYGGETPTTVSTPTFSPAGGTYTTAQTVTISCSTSGATIYYTTNGSTPLASSTMYNGAITISETTTLKAIAIKDGTSSNVAEATYTIKQSGDDPVTGDGIFQLVSSTSELESGKRYLIVSGDKSLIRLDGKEGVGSVSVTSSQIDMNNSSNTALILTMEQVGNYWTVKGDGVYMALTSNSNALNTATTATANTAKWTISVNNGTATIVNANYTGRYLKYNSGAKMFRCYTSGQQDIQIYMEVLPTTTPGDIVKDGKIDWNDLKALVKILLGITPAGENIDSDAADVNGDHETNIADVTKLVNKILQNNK